MKFAAIDIGSNGARMQISRVVTEDTKKPHIKSIISFKKVEYTRYALRLGKDVFYNQCITDKKKEKILKLMQICKLLMELHDVDDYLAFATSAFREAENGKEVAKMVKKETGICIKIIEGSKEAEILGMAIVPGLEKDKSYLHIDVGGGSTELNLYRGQDKVASRSFPIGSIRGVGSKTGQEVIVEMDEWIKSSLLEFCEDEDLIAVGTGGNINKVHTLAKPINGSIRIDEIETLKAHLEGFTFKQKVHLLKLNPDRADTIVPATELYLAAMKSAGIENMLIPKVGLKDGMMHSLMKKHLPFSLDEVIIR